MMPLGLLAAGEKAEVLAIRGENLRQENHGCRRCACHCRLESLGLRCGKTVEMLNNPGTGPLLVRVDDARLALGRGLAMKISVRRMGE
jgi:ferrous iron transport protein A